MSVSLGDAMVGRMFAGGIVITRTGQLLCQLRDCAPGIDFPGTWCACPGGGMLPGETAEQALSRELREEFDATVDIRRRLLTCVSGPGDGYPGTYSVFVANLVTPVARIQCREGIAVGFFSPSDALRFRQHPVADLALRKFLSGAW